jgi:putative transport protein
MRRASDRRMVQSLFGKVSAFLAQQQFLLLFVIVGLGYLIGGIKIRGFSLGATASTIVLGLLVSSVVYLTGAKVTYPDLLSNIFFNLFIYAVGLRIGPQFWFGVKQEGVKFLALGAIAAVLGPLLAYAFGRLLDLPAGSTVGLLGGAATNTPTLGGAQSALASGAAKIPEGMTKEQVSGNLSTAFAITYVFGMAGFLLFQKYVPMLSRTNLRAAAHEVDQKMGALAPSPGTAEALAPDYVHATVRAYRVTNEILFGRPLGELAEAYPRGAILGVEREGHFLEPKDDLVLRPGDEIAVSAPIDILLARANEIGVEVDERDLRSIPTETVEVVVTRDDIVGKTLEELVHGVGHGVYLNGLFRAGDEVPATAETKIHKGDVLRVTGDAAHLGALTKAAGAVSRSDVATDIVFLAVGLAVGALLGAITIPLGKIKISLGTGGGLLLTGLFIAVWRTRRPQLGGPFPEPARRLVEDLGLNIFVAVIGLNAGSKFLDALQGGGVLALLAASMVVGLIPPIVVWVIGLYAMKMNPAVLLGAMAGARTNSPGMRVAQEDTESTAPAIGFPVPFAVGTILLTIAGYVLMLL